ncbi:MAG: lipopolysaccharide kinase InaA family protein [Gemmataceae bacterium]
MNGFISRQIASVNWLLAEELVGSDLLTQLEKGSSWLQKSSAKVVKSTPHRSVYSIESGSGPLHVKHFRSDIREWVRGIFRGTRAFREFRQSLRVREKSINTIEVLGLGQIRHRWGRSEEFLISKTLPSVDSLLEYLEPVDQDNQSAHGWDQEYLLHRGLGQFLAKLHSDGVRHPDLHPGNILVRWQSEQPILFLIDLDGVVLTRSLDWKSSLKNLITLDRWLALRMSDPARMRIWHAYLEARPELDLEPKQAMGQIFSRTWRSLHKQGMNYDRRCLGGNRHFRCFEKNGFRGIACSHLDQDFLDSITADPDKPFQEESYRVLKQSNKSEVVLLAAKNGSGTSERIYKKIRRPWLHSLVASFFRRPPAMRSYFFGHAFLLRALPTPYPLAIFHRYRFGIPLDGYLIFEAVPQSKNLREFLDEDASQGQGFTFQNHCHLLTQLARLIRRMHLWNLSNRDLKAANLLVSPLGWHMAPRGLRPNALGSSKQQHIWFIDLMGVNQRRNISRLKKVKDLARLYLSFLDHPNLPRSSRLRFLLSYLHKQEIDGVHWKKWWKEIDQATQELLESHLVRQRGVG